MGIYTEKKKCDSSYAVPAFAQLMFEAPKNLYEAEGNAKCRLPVHITFSEADNFTILICKNQFL